MALRFNPTWTASWFQMPDFTFIEQQLDRLAQEAFGWRSQTSVALLPIDMYDNGSELVVQAFVPGMRAEHLTVQVEDGVLTIAGTYPQLYDTEEARNYAWYARELRGGKFQRVISLPAKIDYEHATAEVRDGVLKLTFPKAPEAKPRRIAIANAAQATSPTPQLVEATGKEH